MPKVLSTSSVLVGTFPDYAGYSVTAIGSNFGASGVVTAWDPSVSDVSWSDTQVSFVAPSADIPLGEYFAALASGGYSAPFSYDLPPVITGLSVPFAVQGDVISIHGNFGSEFNVATLRQRYGEPVELVAPGTSSTLQGRLNSARIGANGLTAHINGLDSNLEPLTVLPSIETAYPVIGEPGERVALAGNLNVGNILFAQSTITGVDFDGIPVPFIENSAGVSFTIPPNAWAGDHSVAVWVRIANDGTYRSPEFPYQVIMPPVIINSPVRVPPMELWLLWPII